MAEREQGSSCSTMFKARRRLSSHPETEASQRRQKQALDAALPRHSSFCIRHSSFCIRHRRSMRCSPVAPPPPSSVLADGEVATGTYRCGLGVDCCLTFLSESHNHARKSKGLPHYTRMYLKDFLNPIVENMSIRTTCACVQEQVRLIEGNKIKKGDVGSSPSKRLKGSSCHSMSITFPMVVSHWLIAREMDIQPACISASLIYLI